MKKRGWTVEQARTIYIPLLDEGVAVVRPTQGEPLGDDVYRVLPTDDYDPNDEHWEFPPGSVVTCRRETRDGDEVLVAVSRLKDESRR